MPELYRFHVMIGKKRSTVSLPKYLLVMFALRQEYDLTNKKKLHKEIREWCQQTLIDSYYDEHAIYFSQFLHQRMTEIVLDKILSKKFDDLFLNDEYEKIEF